MPEQPEQKPTRFDPKKDYDWADVAASVVTGIWWLVKRHTFHWKGGLIPIIGTILTTASVPTAIGHWVEKHVENTKIGVAGADSTNGPRAQAIKIAGEIIGFEDPFCSAWKLANTDKVIVYDPRWGGHKYWITDNRLSDEGMAQLARENQKQQ